MMRKGMVRSQELVGRYVADFKLNQIKAYRIKMEHKGFLEEYENNTIARIVINAIPYVGGSIDVALSSRWSGIQQRRIKEQLDAISKALSGLEDRLALIEHDTDGSERLYDLLYQIFDNSIKSRCSETRHGYAGVLRDAVIDKNLIPDLEEVVYQISDMRERDLVLLRVVKDLFNKEEKVSGDTVSSSIQHQYNSIECERHLYRFENLGLLDHPRNMMTKRGTMAFEKTEYFDRIIGYLF